MPLLDLLNLKDSAEILLCSELNNNPNYNACYENTVKKIERIAEYRDDIDHRDYITTQTAITEYLHSCQDVGIKVGWRMPDIVPKPGSQPKKEESKWDEERFDNIYQSIYSDSKLQILHAKSGLRITKDNTCWSECPYTGFEGDNRLILQHSTIINIKKWNKTITNHWKDVAEGCLALRKIEAVSNNILPIECMHRTKENVLISDNGAIAGHLVRHLISYKNQAIQTGIIISTDRTKQVN